jgi:hypothetical protein
MSEENSPDTEIKGGEGQTSFSVAANERTVIRVKSRLQRARFNRTVASPGATAGLVVYTAFVARGTPVTVELKDTNGTVASVEAEINRSDQTIPITIPETAEKHLRATVELPDLGLKTATAGVIRLTKPVWIKRIKITRDGREAVSTIRTGDELQIVADVGKAGAGWPAIVRVFRYSDDGLHAPVHLVRTTVDPDESRVRADWVVGQTEDRGRIPSVIPEERGGAASQEGTDGDDEGAGSVDDEAKVEYVQPRYFAEVEVLGVTERSHEADGDNGFVHLADAYVLVVESKTTGEPLPEARVNVHAPDGTETEETADERGRIELEDALPGTYTVRLASVPDEEEDAVTND